MALFTGKKPTLLAVGGDYANMKELRVEDVLPFAFPYGMGGPGGRRRNPISVECTFQRIFRTAMPQLMEPEPVLVMGHMYNRQVSYRSGIITCRSEVN